MNWKWAGGWFCWFLLWWQLFLLLQTAFFLLLRTSFPAASTRDASQQCCSLPVYGLWWCVRKRGARQAAPLSLPKACKEPLWQTGRGQGCSGLLQTICRDKCAPRPLRQVVLNPGLHIIWIHYQNGVQLHLTVKMWAYFTRVRALEHGQRASVVIFWALKFSHILLNSLSYTSVQPSTPRSINCLFQPCQNLLGKLKSHVVLFSHLVLFLSLSHRGFGLISCQTPLTQMLKCHNHQPGTVLCSGNHTNTQFQLSVLLQAVICTNYFPPCSA